MLGHVEPWDEALVSQEEPNGSTVFEVLLPSSLYCTCEPSQLQPCSAMILPLCWSCPWVCREGAMRERKNGEIEMRQLRAGTFPGCHVSAIAETK